MRHHPSTFFSNRIGSFSFYPIFPIFGCNLHNNITQKTVELKFWLFTLIFYGTLMIRNRLKVDFCWFSTIFSNFLLWNHETWFTDISRGGNIFRPFSTPNTARIRSKDSFSSICNKQKFPLDSQETCLLSSLKLPIEVCRMWAPGP